jgi:hypothetical protein
MRGNGRYRTQVPDVTGSVSYLTHDAIELAELQVKLLSVDIKKSTEKTRLCVILAIIGICFLLASIPVGLLALAEVFIEQLDWSQSAALGASTLVGILVSATLAGAAYGILRSGLFTLDRSREELRNNIAWIKSALRNRGQYHARERS